MRVRRSRVTAGAVALSFVLAGCGGAPAATPVLRIDGVTWRAVEVAGAPTIPGIEPTIAFDGDHLAGFGGCNTFSGQVAIADGAVEVGEIRATLKTRTGSANASSGCWLRATRVRRCRSTTGSCVSGWDFSTKNRRFRFCDPIE